MKNFFTFLVIFMLSVFLIPHTNAQFTTSSQTIGSGLNQLDISVSVDGSLNQVKFEVTGPSSVWFGFSFNTTTMSPGSYTILANVSGGNPAEYIMVNHAAPTLQPTQNLTGITSSVSGGRVTYIFYRAISTGDPNDYTFTTTTGALNIAWAYGTSQVLGYHANRGGSTLNFVDPCVTNPPVVLTAIQICEGDSALIFGDYRSTAGNYYDTVSISWGCDSITMQPLIVNPAGVQTDTIYSQLCNNDSLNIGGSWVNTPGNYLVYNTFTGCDSSFYLYIVDKVIVDTTVTIIGNSLNAVPGYSSYNWIDCSTGQTALGSINSSIYSPMMVGTYRVEISHDGCIETSGCHSAGPISIDDADAGSASIRISPNPASTYVSIEMNTFNAEMVVLYDLAGNRIMELFATGDHTLTIPLQNIVSGVYLLQIRNSSDVISRKLIIRN